MTRIDDYERLLDDLHGSLTGTCRELRERLDSVYDQDPAEALSATQSLTEVFRKLKTLKDKGEVLRSGLDALREMDRLKSAILEKVAELGPEYAKYCSARAVLRGEGDAELLGLFSEDAPEFHFDYAELEGAPIGPFRVLSPEAFEEADVLEEKAGLGSGESASVDPASEISFPLTGTDPEPATPFDTSDSFEAEAGVAEAAPAAEAPVAAVATAAAVVAAEQLVAASPVLEEEAVQAEPPLDSAPVPEAPLPEVPPVDAGFVPDTTEPAIDVGLVPDSAEPLIDPAFTPGLETPESSSDDVAALSALLDVPEDESDAAELPSGASFDPDPETAMQDMFGVDTPSPETGPELAPEPEPAVGTAAAGLLSMMDDDDDDDDFEQFPEPPAAAVPAPPMAAAPPTPPAPPPPPTPPAPPAVAGEVAGDAAASLLAELDDDDDDPFEGLDLDSDPGVQSDPLDDF